MSVTKAGENTNLAWARPTWARKNLPFSGCARRLNPDFPSDKREGSRSSGTSRTDENADSWPKTALFLALWLILLGGGLTRLYVFSNTRASVRRHRCALLARLLKRSLERRRSSFSPSSLQVLRGDRGRAQRLAPFSRAGPHPCGIREPSGMQGNWSKGRLWARVARIRKPGAVRGCRRAQSGSVSGENLGPTFSTTLLASSFSTVALPQARTWAMPMGGQPFWRIWPRRESSPTAVLAVR